MLKKEQVEVLLNRAMKSEADFAEIFEEETHTQSMTQLDDNVENISASVRAGAGIRLYKELHRFTATPMKWIWKFSRAS